MGQVPFDYSAWVLRFPGLSGVKEPLATLYAAEAELFLNNSPSSVVQNLTVRALLLQLITAHLATLYSGENGEDPSPIVGTVNQASEGSVSIAAKLEGDRGNRAFWSQTKPGLEYWQATMRYRSATYRTPMRPGYIPGQWPVI
jgi:hypothetical protein